MKKKAALKLFGESARQTEGTGLEENTRNEKGVRFSGGAELLREFFEDRAGDSN